MKNWKEAILNSSKTLMDAIQVLNSSGARIVLIVDNKQRLLGTITDGDIRRALLNHVSMECNVKKVMNHSPLTALFSDNSESVISKMKSMNLLHIPLVDKNNTLVGVETLQHLFDKKKYDNPIFIMAGGFGTRLRPLTEKKPKPMLNVGNRPILETIIGQFIDFGFYNFYISTHYKAEMIRDYFGDGSGFNVNIEYIHEDTPLGTAGSLGLLPDDIPRKPIIIMNGDLLTKVNFELLLDFHSEQNSVATMCIREYDFQVPYGVVGIEGRFVSDIEEKPVHSFFVNAGIYVLEPKIVNLVPSNTRLDMTTFLQSQIDDNNNISIFPLHEYWLDIGREEEYKKAQKDIWIIFNVRTFLMHCSKVYL